VRSEAQWEVSETEERTFIPDMLTLILLALRIWRVSNNAGKAQMGFNSAFKGLKYLSYNNSKIAVEQAIGLFHLRAHTPSKRTLKFCSCQELILDFRRVRKIKKKSYY
jgi:hypothetical protein